MRSKRRDRQPKGLAGTKRRCAKKFDRSNARTGKPVLFVYNWTGVRRCRSNARSVRLNLEQLSLMENTILVTGGAGFIGSNFTRQRLERDSYSIVNLDKLTYAGNLCK